MRQEQIIELLDEAGRPGCTDRRQKHILYLLLNNARRNDSSGGTAHEVANLFNQTIKYRPDLLKSLFPVFAAWCGDPVGSAKIVSAIEWSLLQSEMTAIDA